MAGGANFSGDDDDVQMIVDINVTPLVDITLVLLIIFMVTASYIVSPAIKVDLPKAASGSEQTKTTLAITISKDGAVYLNGERSSDAGIVAYIGGELPKNPDLQAIIAADKVVSHGDVIHVIDLVKRAGVHRFALNVDPGAAVNDAVAVAGERSRRASRRALGARGRVGAGPPSARASRSASISPSRRARSGRHRGALPRRRDGRDGGPGPPAPPPEVRPEPPPPRPRPRRRPRSSGAARPRRPPPGAPPPNEEPPKAGEAPPVFGVTMSSVVAGDGPGMAVPVGNTLMAKPRKAATRARRPAGAGRSRPLPAPVAEVFIAVTAEVIHEVNSADIYPPEAQRMGIEGHVVCKLYIDENGDVRRVTVLEKAGHGFDELARDALKKFKFSPARTSDGKAVPTNITFKYTFACRL